MRLGFLGPFKSDFDVFVASARVFPNRHDDLDQPGLLRTYFGDFCSPGPFNKHLVFIVVFDYLLLPFPRPTQRLGYSQIAFRYRVLIEVTKGPKSAHRGSGSSWREGYSFLPLVRKRSPGAAKTLLSPPVNAETLAWVAKRT